MTPLGGFWLQHASNQARELVEFADELEGGPAGRPGVLYAPVNGAATLRALYRHGRQRGDVAFDPCGFLLDREPTRRAAASFPWLVQTPRPASQHEWQNWMTRALEHQLSTDLVGDSRAPSFLVTACPQLQAAEGARGLYPVLDAALTVQGSADGECWLGVNIDQDYLRQEVHLVRLANALIASRTPGVVLRCFGKQLPPVTDRKLLEGLREIVSSCSANGIHVFLPSSGWLGWLAMAWGAWGFSGGLAKSSWYDRIPSPMTNVTRYDSVFEPQLLRQVRWTVHESLVREPEYRECWCSSCANMNGRYDSGEAPRHQLRVAHKEAAILRALPTAHRKAAVRQRLDEAIAFRDGLPLVLRSRAQADFLDRWRSLV